MFNNYRLPTKLGLSPSSKYWQQHPGYHRSLTNIDGKSYICDFIPLQFQDVSRFNQSLNDALAVMSSKPKFNVPIVPISFWTIISTGDPTPAHLILFTENSDGKLSLDEVEKPPNKNQQIAIPSPVEKTTMMFCINRVFDYAGKFDSLTSGYLRLTFRCIFLNNNRDISFGYYGLHLLKEFIAPECFSRFFNDESLHGIDSKIPHQVRSYGSLHWRVECLGDHQIPFKQSVFALCAKKNASYFNGSSQAPNAPFLFIHNHFDPKARYGLYYKGVKAKEFIPLAIEINKRYNSPCRDDDLSSLYKVAPNPNFASQNNLFSKFMQSLVIPYPDDPFRDLVREQLQQHLSFITTAYTLDYTFSTHTAKRGPRLHENNAFANSEGLSTINQSFVDELKKASLLGSLDALYYLSHFTLLQSEGEVPDELVEYMKAASDYGNAYASFEYGLYLATKAVLERLNPNSGAQLEIIKDAVQYLEKAAKKKPFAVVFIAFFAYICKDKIYAAKCLARVEKTIPSVQNTLAYLQVPDEEQTA
ncbi:hypothetical protein TRFO_25140 [Tritrichomonas foetus]|uniref:Uncharacterized protein n=1 Tax=Tritrichomonas foetus TaxID=1144522 RepID=A0A1J4KAJ5_9EUKA|nr:hypothetical protein TRFO_25140 [Tritrichomonas foetus]|eukprot:OHT06686.1 hypothetical protein TRFO_25140 [Tritrichomonas foetus]